MKYFIVITSILSLCWWSCQPTSSNEPQAQEGIEVPSIERSDFGNVDSQAVYVYAIYFPGALQATVTNYGAILTSLSVPDKEGNIEDITLGYDSLAGYLEATPYLGAIVGRYGNRIAKGTFSIDGETYTLAQNNFGNHLHGGIKGFDKVVWDVEEARASIDDAVITLSYTSPDGEEGYPGNLTIKVTYTFTPDEWKIDYAATTDQPTVVNLTQHAYFNLSGNTREDILAHELHLAASRYLPIDETFIPTGELRPVEGTPFDFTEAKKIGQEINADNEQITRGDGYDHCWVLDENYEEVADKEGPYMGALRKVGTLSHSSSGRNMEVYTTEPGVQFYSGNFLDGTIVGKHNTTYTKRMGLCLETQHFPDSPNQSDFPSVVLRPGETYQSQTAYKFGILGQ